MPQLHTTHWYDFFSQEEWYSASVGDWEAHSTDGHEDDGEISGEEDMWNQADEQVGDVDGGDNNSEEGEGSADENCEASNRNQQEIALDIWPEETNPSLERMVVIRGLRQPSTLRYQDCVSIKSLAGYRFCCCHRPASYQPRRVPRTDTPARNDTSPCRRSTHQNCQSMADFSTIYLNNHWYNPDTYYCLPRVD
ncbi:hypothetical protein CONLIGDRAFT_699715 [Coniochaeta ligniaria NRRL 30616]|uniref:Uncharacterized protein n=1 Tax=Coniochaeta ligniaria NRRL 30616 TaxID=1408157 RepID=A0A1J7IZK6_9PEZI|nr:hypothetical protein CONLIGDRAFT_699715 [Coniochaeta ligniaria NRRL 30616]